MARFRIGSRVKVDPHNDNENYDNFKNEILIVTHVSTGTDTHPGYDEGINVPGKPKQGLYDFTTEDGKSIGSSLYDYELTPA